MPGSRSAAESGPRPPGEERCALLAPVRDQFVERARLEHRHPTGLWAPTSEPFSTTQTATSRSAAAASCFRRIAAARPEGPAPTTTTSYSIRSRSLRSSLTALSSEFANDYIGSQQKRECAARPNDSILAMPSPATPLDTRERQAAIALLRWYIEMGAGEAIGSEPANRFAPPPAVDEAGHRAGDPPPRPAAARAVPAAPRRRWPSRRRRRRNRPVGSLQAQRP